MACQIATAFGPCVNNRDYLFLLEKAMFGIGHEDGMVIELANEVMESIEWVFQGEEANRANTNCTEIPHSVTSTASPTRSRCYGIVVLKCLRAEYRLIHTCRTF
ncbi:hypothetical protein Tsubulata_023875 [Turnera subulata]|uniref:Gamma-glutamylcyclotransferase n=1 Tax=Turnera subulata TaxID=218843 RepID=A0A9Q0F7M4_9ROSI|nr:hypothetical protein Tsubulata_023875 [Turnera subulata]